MSRFGKLFRATAVAALTAVGVSPAMGQQSAPAPLPDISDYLTHNQVSQVGWGRNAAAPGCPPGPCSPCPPGVTYAPGMPSTGGPPTGQPMIDPNAFGPGTASAANLGGFDGAVGSPTTIGGAYIEGAVPATMARLRFDAAYGNNRPDRAEFFYAKCGCFVTAPAPFTDPTANGPPMPETMVDYQEVMPSVEVAISQRWSVFMNIPIRWINPQQNQNAAGLSDISFGTKYAFILNERRAVTFFLRTIAPSGRSTSGLGSSNWWLEPGLLWQEQLTCKWQVFGEVRDQFSLAPQSDFTGNVLRYGLGSNYIVASGRWGYVAPVVEFVGWTVLSGRESLVGAPPSKSAYGDTIVNAKLGMRIGFGPSTPGQAYPSRSDLYVGYGRALTGEVWYQDMFRLEYRFFF